ncbi:MAG: hypothetical protein R6W83_00465 [Cryobacterium sp.]
MPSYRIIIAVGALRAGVSPASVLPAAAAAAAELTTVEATDLTLVDGSARLSVRFSADSAELARQIGAHVLAVTDTLATPKASLVTERVQNRWVPVSPR